MGTDVPPPARTSRSALAHPPTPWAPVTLGDRPTVTSAHAKRSTQTTPPHPPAASPFTTEGTEAGRAGAAQTSSPLGAGSAGSRPVARTHSGQRRSKAGEAACARCAHTRQRPSGSEPLSAFCQVREWQRKGTQVSPATALLPNLTDPEAESVAHALGTRFVPTCHTGADSPAVSPETASLCASLSAS